MPANTVIRRIDLSSAWKALAESPLIADVAILVHSKNVDPCAILGDADEEVALAQGARITLRGVDLNEVFVKGTAGDVLAVIGATRT